MATRNSSGDLLREEIDQALRQRKGRQYDNLGEEIISHLHQVAFDELRGYLASCRQMSTSEQKQHFYRLAYRFLTWKRIDRAIRDVGQARSITVIMRPATQL